MLKRNATKEHALEFLPWSYYAAGRERAILGKHNPEKVLSSLGSFK